MSTRPSPPLRLLLPLLYFLPAVQAAPAPSGEEKPTSVPQQEAQTPDVATRVAHRQARLVSLFRALAKTLDPVEDKASADAAAPGVLRLVHILRQLKEESHRASERGPAAEEAMDAWRRKYGKAFAKLTAKTFEKPLKLMLAHPACHGSTALEEALSQLFDELAEKEADAPEKEEAAAGSDL